jgi:hypothetical protein
MRIRAVSKERAASGAGRRAAAAKADSRVVDREAGEVKTRAADSKRDCRGSISRSVKDAVLEVEGAGLSKELTTIRHHVLREEQRE